MASASSARASHPAHCDSFDGLRGLGILCVIGYHAQLPGFSRGYLAVDMFLVLSGFLITTLLAREFAAGGAVSFGAFCLRRVLRLSPLYFLYVLLLAVGWYSHLLRFDDENGGGHLLRLCFYVYNLSQSELELYLGEVGISSHLWSLSLEEQFYLFWPFFSVFLLRGSRARGILLLVLILVQMVCLANAASVEELIFRPWTRGLGLTAGCAAALAVVWFPRFARVAAQARVQWFAGAAFVASILTLPLGPGEDKAVIGRSLPVVLASTALLSAALWQRRSCALSVGLSFRPIAYLGKISYGIYMWHMLCLALATLLVERPLLQAAFTALTSIGLAALCYAYYERPFLMLKERFAPPPGLRRFHQIQTPVTLSTATTNPIAHTKHR